MSCVLLPDRSVWILIVPRETIEDQRTARSMDKMLSKTMKGSHPLIFTIGDMCSHLRRLCRSMARTLVFALL